MDIYDLFQLMGGLALFLFGMSLMGDALEKRAGKRLKHILEQLTRSPVKAVLLGAGVTAVIQSSSATTVMVVGFVNSGIMQLRQAIGVVMGANIGTTVTAWLLSMTGIQGDSFLVTLFKPSTFSPLLAFVGIVMLLAFSRKRDTAFILLGFAVLMFGMQSMSQAVSGLAQDEGFTSLLLKFSNPFLGVLVGAVVTAVIQSSSASVGILQAIALTGGLTFGAALPIIMGQNIGTCITAILSAIGANRSAKRVAAAHLLFNLIGTVVILILFYTVEAFVHLPFLALPINALHIAAVHTAFNLITTAMLFPFIGSLERLSTAIIRDARRGERVVMLDERLLVTPPIAIEQCRRQTEQMAREAQHALVLGDGLLNHYDARVFDQVSEGESLVDRYEDALGSYLVKVSAQGLSQSDSRQVAKLLHVIGDLERISDHAVNLGESAQEVHMKGLSFSKEAQEQLAVLRAAVRDVLDMTVTSLAQRDIELAQHVEPMEEVIDLLRDNIKESHVRRLQKGECTLELGFVLSDLLNNLERVSDHCSNIAANVIEMDHFGDADSHEYKKHLHEGEAGRRFQALYDQYAQKYSLQCAIEEEGVQV